MKYLMGLLLCLAAGTAQAQKGSAGQAAAGVKSGSQQVVMAPIDIVGAMDNPQMVYVLTSPNGSEFVLKLERPVLRLAENVDRESFEENEIRLGNPLPSF